MGKTELIERLNALATSSRNRSNTARLRDIFLHVEHAIKAGVPLQLIFEELKAEGFTFTYNSFINALVKIRKEFREDSPSKRIIPDKKNDKIRSAIDKEETENKSVSEDDSTEKTTVF